MGPASASPTTAPASQRSSAEPVATAAPETTGPAAGFVADADRLAEDLAALQAVADEHGGIRAAGTSGYEASVDHVAARLRDIGFAIETPEIAFTGFRDLGATLEIGDEVFRGPDELRALRAAPALRGRGSARSGCGRRA